MSQLPQEAREGLMRAWLAVLHARHPEVIWIPVGKEFRHLDPRSTPPPDKDSR